LCTILDISELPLALDSLVRGLTEWETKIAMRSLTTWHIITTLVIAACPIKVIFATLATLVIEFLFVGTISKD